MKNNYTLYELRTNYRCRSKICDAANSLISHNKNRYPKKTIAHESGGTVVVESFKTPAEEMAFLANELVATTNGKITNPLNGNDTCAILCRTNAIAKQIAVHLKSLGIPVAEKKEVVVPPDWRRAKLLLSVMANAYADFTVYQYLVASVRSEEHTSEL